MSEPGDKTAPQPVRPSAYGAAWIASAWGDTATAKLLAGELRPRPRVEQALRLARLGPGVRLLDIACGRGEVPALASMLGASAVGLDFSAEVLAIAQQLRDRPGSGAMHLVRADATRLPFADGSFDRVTMLDIIEHLTPAQLQSMFREVRRVLAPHGYAVVHTLPNKWVYELTFPLLARLVPKLPRDPRGDIERSVHINEQTLPALRDSLREAGFDTRLWLEQLMPAQARWNAGEARYGDRRDTIYPALSGIVGRLLELVCLTPLRLLLSNDIYGVAWPAGGSTPQLKLPWALTERLLLRLA